MQALVYDLGGTHLRCGVVDSDGLIHLFRKERIHNFLDTSDPAFLWSDIFSRMLDYERTVHTTVGAEAPLVLAFPGPIRDHREILSAPTIFGKTQVFPDVCAELEQKTNRSVHLLNDVSAAGYHLSTQTTATRFMIVTVSSGIGSKLFDRNHPDGVIDDPPYAGEIGHLVVDPRFDAPVCDCGGIGHLGGIASGRGVEHIARLRASLDPPEFSRSACVQRFGARLEDLCNERHLVPAIRVGDSWSLSILKDCTRPLAMILLAVIMGAGVEQVIIIGGFALSLGDAYLQLLRALITEASDYEVVSDLLPNMIHLGSVNEEACLQGAAVYAQRLWPGAQ